MKNKEKGLSLFGLTMMALGTIIGGSFFFGSAISLQNAGASVILGYILVAITVYIILFSLSEMTVVDPNPGSFRIYAERAYGKGIGFTVGWAYWTGLVLAMSSEAVAVSTFIKMFIPQLSISILGSIIIIIVMLVNLLGTNKLSVLESSLATIKLFAIISFLVLGTFLIFGNHKQLTDIMPSTSSIFPKGFWGLAGSMVLILFSYAGFEVIGLAASEVNNPHKTIPKAIKLTIIILASLYISSTIVVIFLINPSQISIDESPFVLALSKYISWAKFGLSVIMISAILSTMLASTFGLARTVRSLADSGYAFKFLLDKGDIPYRGIIFSGLAMLTSFSLSFFLPKKIYVFLVSSSGFIIIFTYLMIILSHLKFRKENGCPPSGNCQLPLYPFSTYLGVFLLLFIIISMPFIDGQGIGMLAGISIIILYMLVYQVLKNRIKGDR